MRSTASAVGGGLLCLSVMTLGASSCTSSGGAGGDGQGGDQAGGSAGEEAQAGAGGVDPGTGGDTDPGTGGDGGTAGSSAGTGGTPGGAGGSQAMGGKASGGAGSGGAGGAKGGAGGTPVQGGTGGTVVNAQPCSAIANCDDFEAYAANGNPGGQWSGFATGGGSLAVDTTRAFSGTKSVKISITPSGSEVRMRHGGYGLLPANNLFLRMRVWLDAAPTGTNLHWHWIQARGNVSGESGGKLGDVFLGPGASNGGNNWTLYGGGASGGYQDCFISTNVRLPVGKWMCYEFQIDGAGNNLHTWIDGRLDEAADLTAGAPLVGGCIAGHDFTNGIWYIPPVRDLFFGWHKYHTLAATRTIWVDDVVVSATRTACPRP